MGFHTILPGAGIRGRVTFHGRQVARPPTKPNTDNSGPITDQSNRAAADKEKNSMNLGLKILAGLALVAVGWAFTVLVTV